MLSGNLSNLRADIRRGLVFTIKHFKKFNASRILSTLVLGIILSLSFQWLLGVLFSSSYFIQLISPLQSFVGNAMELNSILTNTYVQLGITLFAVVAGDTIVKSDAYRNFITNLKKIIVAPFASDSLNDTLDPLEAEKSNKTQTTDKLTQDGSNLNSTVGYSLPSANQNGYADPNRLRLTWKPNALHALNDAIVPSVSKSSARDTGEASTMLSRIGLVIKTIVASALPPRLFIRIAKKVPAIGGWIEHVLVPPGRRDDMQYIVLHETAQYLQDFVSILPKATLYRILNRKDKFGFPPLYRITLTDIEPKEKYKILLQAIEPEYRLAYLTEVIRFNNEQNPLIHQFDDDDFDTFWDVIVELLAPLQQKQLSYTKDRKGDSLLMKFANGYGPRAMVKILEPFDLEERKAYLSEICSHGSNPVIKLFTSSFIKNSKQVFSVLPKKDWKDIFNLKPTNWTMTIGEKLMLLKAVNRRRDTDTINYLRKEFGLTLPSKFRNMKMVEKGPIFREIRKSLKGAACDARENFKQQHGECPEAILESEPHLAPKDYLPSFYRLQRQHHPDKVTQDLSNQSQQAPNSDRSAKLNAAREFVSNKKARFGYWSPFIPKKVTITSELSESGQFKIVINKKY